MQLKIIFLCQSLNVNALIWKKRGFYKQEFETLKFYRNNNFKIFKVLFCINHKNKIFIGDKANKTSIIIINPFKILSFFKTISVLKKIINSKKILIKTNQLNGIFSALLLKLFFKKAILILRIGFAPWDLSLSKKNFLGFF